MRPGRRGRTSTIHVEHDHVSPQKWEGKEDLEQERSGQAGTDAEEEEVVGVGGGI